MKYCLALSRWIVGAVFIFSGFVKGIDPWGFQYKITDYLHAFGWDSLAAVIDIRCFQNEPSIKSSLKFLRRTPWAREQVEALYRREMT